MSDHNGNDYSNFNGYTCEWVEQGQGIKTENDFTRFTAMLKAMDIGYSEHECDGDLEVYLCCDPLSDGDRRKLCFFSKEGHDVYFKFNPKDGCFLYYGVNP